MITGEENSSLPGNLFVPVHNFLCTCTMHHVAQIIWGLFYTNPPGGHAIFLIRWCSFRVTIVKLSATHCVANVARQFFLFRFGRIVVFSPILGFLWHINGDSMSGRKWDIGMELITHVSLTWSRVRVSTVEWSLSKNFGWYSNNDPTVLSTYTYSTIHLWITNSQSKTSLSSMVIRKKEDMKGAVYSACHRGIHASI